MSVGNEKPNYALAQNEAIVLLAKHGYTKPPVDPIEMAKRLGISVHLASFDHIDKDISGLYILRTR